MIPKIIHYCWFGGNPLDKRSQKCISSWKKYFPDYEIVEWNEHNFDIHKVPFMERAYEEKKWAFVSDVARLIIIYENGGIYFDTDVEVIRPYDDLLDTSTGFLGYERTGFVNSGLGFGAEKGNPLLKELIETYQGIDFDVYADNLSEIACPHIQTKLMEKYGFVRENRTQQCCGFTVYKWDYFSPMDYATGRIRKTKNTHSIHWYNASWTSEESRELQKKMRLYKRFLGQRAGEVFWGVSTGIKNEGLLPYFARRITRKLGK